MQPMRNATFRKQWKTIENLHARWQIKRTQCADSQRDLTPLNKTYRKRVFYFFARVKLFYKASCWEAWAVYFTIIKHSGHLRTFEKCRKHSPAARVFYISLMFSNARGVLSRCNALLRLVYLLIINSILASTAGYCTTVWFSGLFYLLQQSCHF